MKDTGNGLLNVWHWRPSQFLSKYVGESIIIRTKDTNILHKLYESQAYCGWFYMQNHD
jgi:hypothetical protein